MNAELLTYLGDELTYRLSFWLFRSMIVPTDTAKNTADTIETPADIF
jgi:hypothetical protein